MKRLLPITAVLALASASPLAAQAHEGHHPSSGTEAEVIAVVDAFHTAMARGDSVAMLALLSPAVRVHEGGGVETFDEYRSHHLGADIAFATSVERVRTAPTVTVHGDVAWISSTSRATGRYRDRDIDSRAAESMILVRDDGAWKIVSIHWSSR